MGLQYCNIGLLLSPVCREWRGLLDTSKQSFQILKSSVWVVTIAQTKNPWPLIGLKGMASMLYVMYPVHVKHALIISVLFFPQRFWRLV